MQPGTSTPEIGTISLVAIDAGYCIRPAEGREILIGRSRPDVHLCIGEDDLGVSRLHVRIRWSRDRWWIHREGRRQVLVGRDRHLWPGGEPAPLSSGWTSIVVHGAGQRMHVVEVAVAGDRGWRRPAPWNDRTISTNRITLSHEERLAIVAIGEPYLRDEPAAVPRSWKEAEERLRSASVDPAMNHRRIERVVGALRLRLAADGVHGLVTPEVESPGDALKRNLLTLLIRTDSIGPADLGLVDHDAEY